jgi:histidinol-phosphate aminotransferase
MDARLEHDLAHTLRADDVLDRCDHLGRRRREPANVLGREEADVERQPSLRWKRSSSSGAILSETRPDAERIEAASIPGSAVRLCRRMADWLRSLLVPAARRLPSNAEYLAHLDAAAADRTLIRLASNENTEPPSPRVREALDRAYLDANLSPPTVPPLRHALAERYGVGVDRVLVGAGSTELIDATLRTFVRAGDEVVLPRPSWPVFRRRLEALEARIIDVPLVSDERTYAYDVDALLAAITKRTKLLVVCTPNNPTGNSLTLDDVRGCTAASPLLLLDAAYADFDEDVDVTSVIHKSDRVVLTRTFSKAYCLAGLRVGYALGDSTVLDYVDRFLVPGSSVSSAALHAALAALEDEDHHRRQVERIRSERARLTAELRDCGIRAYDSKGNFVAIQAPDGARALAAAILAHGVVVRVMDERLVRITVGRREENDALLAAFELERA